MSALTPAAYVEAHFRAVIEERVADVVAAYDDTGDAYVFVEGPRWSTRGHAAIAAGWSAYLKAPFRLRSYAWTEGPLQGSAGGLGWCAGVADFGAEREGRSLTVRFRCSFVLRGVEGGWRILHEHFSQPAADPYGTGDWLKAGS